MDCAEESGGAFVIAGTDSPERFEFSEEVFDEMACAVEAGVMLAPEGAIDLGGDGDFDAGGLEDIDHAFLSVVSAIGEQGAEPADDFGQQRIGTVEVVEMARCQMEGDRVAERVAQSVQLGAQSAFAAPDRFLGPIPPFAPALA